MKLCLINRKKYPTAFSIERLFEQLSSVFRRRGLEVAGLELPHYNNTPQNVLKNGDWARTQVQALVEGAGRGTDPVIKHVTGDVTSVLFWLRSPCVITIHDCNPLLRYPAYHPRYWFYRYVIYEWPARRADAVTVISEKTKRELLQLTNCREDNIRVIPNFVDPAFSRQPKAFSSDRPTLLQVGVKENKNVKRIAQALKGLNCKLSIIGSPSEEDAAALVENGIEYTARQGLSDEELRQQYASCDALIFASTYEGFGLPILEAQVTGRPVIASNISPHREVAGEGGAELVDPYEVDSIRRGVLNVLSDADRRDRLISAGYANAANYDIGEIADRYMALYRELLQRQTPGAQYT